MNNQKTYEPFVREDGLLEPRPNDGFSAKELTDKLNNTNQELSRLRAEILLLKKNNEEIKLNQIPVFPLRPMSPKPEDYDYRLSDIAQIINRIVYEKLRLKYFSYTAEDGVSKGMHLSVVENLLDGLIEYSQRLEQYRPDGEVK